MRLECWVNMIELSDRVESMAEPLLTLYNAIKGLRDNDSFHTVLGVILRFGNILNHGSAARGEAKAFDLQTLNKLVGLRDQAGRQNLLDYIVSSMYAVNNEFANMKVELASTAAIAKYDYKGLDKDILNLDNTTMETATTIKKLDINNDKTRSFLADAERNVEVLDIVGQRLKHKFSKLLLYYGYSRKDAQSVEINDFFDMITTFLNTYDDAMQRGILLEMKEQQKGKKKQTVGKRLAEVVTVEKEVVEACEKSKQTRSPRFQSRSNTQKESAPVTLASKRSTGASTLDIPSDETLASTLLSPTDTLRKSDSSGGVLHRRQKSIDAGEGLLDALAEKSVTKRKGRIARSKSKYGTRMSIRKRTELKSGSKADLVDALNAL
ncbi:hypothetical protein SARC_10112 [Sphaeroforma arctica JP610]|uniref:FH2 domain-containing protein n=1 Tax=Sphaeroforma arctica JP610 TaxID=667725 RepID=A0A0L0FLR7_9EUKA|nr:hypothetical protein SARC_10112 [Sphaeroforma arctica JP610]KNC77426.1 hypothetical protein SARC_10112 [Sphaeroforma arctica JP610]|eukprot:XP_014151328.1 hypothetical protein SARC_10112 [Sphaeroforma arctica JP610]